MPGTADLRRDGNHLAGQGSLYLRQHAHNPVDWYPWGDLALARARDEGLPIFLSIGYSACHWCHVMEHETFERDDIAAFLNEHFVSIKVDREERPDLDSAYMEAVQVMVGNGGWPMSVFLTPSLKPFHGGTYFPPEAFLGLLQAIVAAFTDRRDEIEALSERVRAAVGTAGVGEPAVGTGPANTRVDAAVARVLREVDPRWGGIGTRMKFPMVPLWDWLLHVARQTGDAAVTTAVRLTLDQVARGGLRDAIGGGFHRYAVEPTWTVPHFEKMLYDNAGLARLYVEASAALHEPAYADVARDTLDFLLRDLRVGPGGFAASVDADSADGEGAFYTWTPAELGQAAGPQDGPVLAALLGVTDDGPCEGRSVPTRRAGPDAVAQSLGLPVDFVAGVFDRRRADLLAVRARRAAPPIDPKVITSWNGMAIAALAEAGAVLDEPRYRQAAAEAATFLWTTHRRADGGLAHVSYDGRPAADGVLDDYGHLAVGLLALHSATGDADWLRRALDIIGTARRRFARPGGGFFETPDDALAPLGRRVDVFDNAMPSGTSAMVRAMRTAGALAGSDDLDREVQRTLQSTAALTERATLEVPGLFDALLLRRRPFRTATVTGRPDDPATDALVTAFHRLDAPWAALARDPSPGPATARVCESTRCLAPTSSPDDLGRLLLDGWAR